MECTIRRASAGDLKAISALSKAWADEGITRGLVASTPVDLAACEVWVCIAEELIVAYLSGNRMVSENMCIFPPNSQYFAVDELYVVPELRGKQVGSRLYRDVEAELEREGIRHILLSSASVAHQKIIDFYQKNGFDLWTMVFYKNIGEED